MAAPKTVATSEQGARAVRLNLLGPLLGLHGLGFLSLGRPDIAVLFLTLGTTLVVGYVLPMAVFDLNAFDDPVLTASLVVAFGGLYGAVWVASLVTTLRLRRRAHA